MKLSLRKVYLDTIMALVPADDKTTEYVKKLSLTDVLTGDFVRPRNVGFHRKYFSLINTAYDIWDTPLEVNYRGQMVQCEKDIDEFREWLTVRAGFYRFIATPSGHVELKAQSISFAKMEQDQFERLFSATIDVIIKHVIPPTANQDEYMAIFQRILDYD